MASLLFPDATEAATLRSGSLTDLQTNAGVSEEAWLATSAALGTVPNLRTLAMLPASVVTAAIARAWLRVPPAASDGGGEGESQEERGLGS